MSNSATNGALIFVVGVLVVIVSITLIHIDEAVRHLKTISFKINSKIEVAPTASTEHPNCRYDWHAHDVEQNIASTTPADPKASPGLEGGPEGSRAEDDGIHRILPKVPRHRPKLQEFGKKDDVGTSGDEPSDQEGTGYTSTSAEDVKSIRQTGASPDRGKVHTLRDSDQRRQMRELSPSEIDELVEAARILQDARDLRGQDLTSSQLYRLTRNLWEAAPHKTPRYARFIANETGQFPEGWDRWDEDGNPVPAVSEVPAEPHRALIDLYWRKMNDLHGSKVRAGLTADERDDIAVARSLKYLEKVDNKPSFLKFLRDSNREAWDRFEKWVVDQQPSQWAVDEQKHHNSMAETVINAGLRETIGSTAISDQLAAEIFAVSTGRVAFNRDLLYKILTKNGWSPPQPEPRPITPDPGKYQS